RAAEAALESRRAVRARRCGRIHGVEDAGAAARRGRVVADRAAEPHAVLEGAADREAKVEAALRGLVERKAELAALAAHLDLLAAREDDRVARAGREHRIGVVVLLEPRDSEPGVGPIAGRKWQGDGLARRRIGKRERRTAHGRIGRRARGAREDARILRLRGEPARRGVAGLVPDEDPLARETAPEVDDGEVPPRWRLHDSGR